MFPLGFLIEIFVSFLIEMLGYGIARITIPFITLGKVRVDPPSSSSNAYNWLGYRKAGTRTMLSPTSAGFIGILIFIALIVALLFALIEPQ